MIKKRIRKAKRQFKAAKRAVKSAYKGGSGVGSVAPKKQYKGLSLKVTPGSRVTIKRGSRLDKVVRKTGKTVRSASSRGAAISAGLKKYYRNKKRSIGRKFK